MSDYLSAAAAKLPGVPEELVLRSATARAQAQGVDVDDILNAWAGGEDLPETTTSPEPEVAAATREPPPTPAPETPSTPTPEPATPEPEVAAPAPGTPQVAVVPDVPATVVMAPGVHAAPILVGRKDSHTGFLVTTVAVILLGAALSVFLPAVDAVAEADSALPGTTPVYSELALQGREVYVQEGCWLCHTEQVRPIVTDAGLGPVTVAARVPDLSPATLGTRRVGPDLSAVGSRAPTDSSDWLTGFLRHPSSAIDEATMPSYAYLSEQDLAALTRYLLEHRP